MEFVKMQGLGNDYTYVDCFRQPALIASRPLQVDRAILLF